MIALAEASLQVLAYRPFLDPLWGAWSNGVWPFLLIPLCVAVSVVYKSIKCRSMSDVPKQAAQITVWIILGMIFAGLVLAVIVKGIDYSRS